MKSVLTTWAKPGLSAVLPTDPREVQALDEFIALKEQQINRIIQVNENLDAILETNWLKDYILTFPNRDQLVQHASILARGGKCQRKNRSKGGAASLHGTRYGD